MRTIQTLRKLPMMVPNTNSAMTSRVGDMLNPLWVRAGVYMLSAASRRMFLYSDHFRSELSTNQHDEK
jgi:hypothetical protein